MNVNIGRMMANRAYLSPDVDGFVGSGYRFTFQQANERVNQLANYLINVGIEPKDRVAILTRNNQQFPTAMFAAAKIGAITVPLNWRLHSQELSYILNDCQASLLVYDAEFSGTVQKIKNEISVNVYVVVGDDQGTDIEFENTLAGQSKQEPEIVGGGDDPAIIMYTSGTTGKPKGAILSHFNMFTATIGISHTIDWRYRDRFLSVAPLFHIGGLAPIVTNIHCGATSVFLPDFNPVEAWRSIEKERINFMMSVPVMLSFMLMVPDIDKIDLSSLRHIVCGGSVVAANLIEAYHKLGIEVQNVYGITEYSGAVTFWTHEMGMDKFQSVGKPVFHGDIQIVDPNTLEELPDGEVGEIWCRGPQVFQGYWNNQEDTGKALFDGWYRSGDLGKKDQDGFIYVVDRLKDMIISGGENIYPAELEAVIATLPSVAEVAVVGAPDEQWGEVSCACVVVKPGYQLKPDEVIEVCQKNLARYKVVRKVVFTDALPRNAVGKIMKNVLKSSLTQTD